MRMRNVVVSTLSEEAFVEILSKLETLGANVVEKRYDLLYKRYEIYAKANHRQCYKLRRFVKSYNASLMEL